MDALDEFFSTWCAPDAWCERCGEHPALHVVRRGPAAKSGGFPTYVQVWDAARQTHLAVCRRCFKNHVKPTGESGRQPASIDQRQSDYSWLSALRRFWRYNRYRIHVHVVKWWRGNDAKHDIPKPETLWR